MERSSNCSSSGVTARASCAACEAWFPQLQPRKVDSAQNGSFWNMDIRFLKYLVRSHANQVDTMFASCMPSSLKPCSREKTEICTESGLRCARIWCRRKAPMHHFGIRFTVATSSYSVHASSVTVVSGRSVGELHSRSACVNSPALP